MNPIRRVAFNANFPIARPSWLMRAKSTATNAMAKKTRKSQESAQIEPKQENLMEFQSQSQILSRGLEFYDRVLAEDLMILTYNHALARPDSPYLKTLQEQHESLNQEFLDLERRKFQSMFEQARKSDRKATAAIHQQGVNERPMQRALKPKPAQFTDHLKYLPMRPRSAEELAKLPPVYERLPRLKEMTLRMIMPEAVTHSKKVLLNGLLALQLVTTQHGDIVRAEGSDAKLRVRTGMPIGVQVRMTDEETMYTFIDKLVETVMPKLRDFRGFSKQSCAKPTVKPGIVTVHPGRVTLAFDAEAWLAFPEIELSYLKFPQLGSTGSLQPFELDFTTSAECPEDARLLLSGFRIPFTYDEPPAELDEVVEEEFVHEI